MMIKKCLVTGAAGFIGSHLAERLVEEGCQVTGIDCFNDNYSRPLKEANLNNLLKSPSFNFIEGNLIKLPLVELVKDADVIFHQAAQPGVRSSWGKNFNIYIENNILATQMLLEASKGANLKKFIYASTSSAYGDSPELPLREESLPLPVSPYGVSKLAAEQLCFLYCKNYKVPVIALRYFTVFGPRQRPDMAFNIFIQALLSGKEITVFGDGAQTRDFTFISDAIEANILAMKSPHTCELFNIGGGCRVTLAYCLETLEKISGIAPKIKREEFCRGDMQHTWADISKAKRMLGYNPKISLEEGLKKELDWLKSAKNIM